MSGEPLVARAWLDAADERATPDNELATATSALRITTAAVIALRRGDSTSAVHILAQGWREIEGSAAVDFARSIRALRAFALENSHAARAYVEMQLAHLRDAPRGEFTYLATAWPELRAFLVREGLVNEAG